MSHPAQYSQQVLVVLRWLLPTGTRIHDPFAGPGSRLGGLADERLLHFTGTEIEPGFIADPRVKQGDATDPATYPAPRQCVKCGGTYDVPGWAHAMRVECPDHDASVGYTIVTSPVYPNGMADHFKSTDKSERRTYRHGLAKLTGNPDVELATRNMGRWGYRGRKLDSPARMMYWSLARQAAACWTGAERVLLNVSDFKAGTVTVPVIEGWVHTLAGVGFNVIDVHRVKTPRYRNGQNAAERVEHEVVLDLRP
jgi:hypothetical protein